MILHLSKTPLVGAPGKLAKFLRNNLNVESFHYCEHDYPGELKNIFLSESICLNSNDQLFHVLAEKIKMADVIHVHNDVSAKIVELIKKCASKNARYIYQVHSPLKEGPNFIDLSEHSSLKFDRKLVVSQYHPRLYVDYTPVPNVIDFDGELNLIRDNEIPRVIFSPAHTRTGGRWNDKVSPNLTKVLSYLDELGDISLINPGKLTPRALFEIRKSCHITIDEIATGGFHQVSLEGLAAGNVVINNSDFISTYYFEALSKGSSSSPFYTMNESNCYERIKELIFDKEKIRHYQRSSKSYFEKYLGQSVTTDIFKSVYDF